ncbi:MAG: acetyl-CoA carboxylase [Clostridia bacterium]|nr:acetyl-CoA carboxylase [Clostridia bacterium]
MEKGTTIGSEKIAALFDSGTFVETGAYMKRAGGDLTGVVCGYGAIGGKLVYAFAQDSDRKKGAFDALQAEKIAMLYGMAMKNGAPVVGMFDSVGAVIADGASAMSAYGKVLKCVSDASGVIPQIAVISGVCSGMAATVAAMFDLVVTVKDKSQLFVNAPFIVGKEVGSADYAAQNGLAAVSAADEADANAKVAKLIAMLPSNNEEGVVAEEITDDVNRTSATGVAGKELICEIADASDFVEIGAEYATEMLTGFVRFGGVTCGVVANNSSEKNGTITCDGAKKAAKLISLCDSLSIPVVTLTDSVGVEVSKAAEGAPLAAQLGKLAMAYATADTAKITVVTGKAYGAAFTLMSSKALGADMVYALPEAEISVMAPESAVAFLWNDKITEKTTRATLEEKWVAENAAPASAAADGSIDDVINAGELRQRICAAVYMLMMKNSGTPARKHCNLPL